MRAEPRPPHVLYVVYWGVAEPLGRSLVLPAVVRLASLGADITLLSFDKPGDLARAEQMLRIRASLAQAGVEWVPLRYHKRPKWPATALDVLQGVVRGLWARRRGPIDIVHARTFVGGVIGRILAPLLRARLVFHNEGFYPDEQVDGGIWAFGSPPHRLARAVESGLYAGADGIVALSARACDEIARRPAVRAKGTPVVLVPSCVDLARFAWPSPGRQVPATSTGGAPRLVYVGSIGGRYLFAQVAAFVGVARRLFGDARLRVLTPTDPAQVRASLTGAGLAQGAWSVAWVPHEKMPEELAAQDAGLFFLTQGLSEHGCSPTKIGEYWASGLPVVTTPNVGDSEDVIARERVGVVVRELSERGYERALLELQELRADPELASRCRAAAEAHYGLESACLRQYDLYRRLVQADHDH